MSSSLTFTIRKPHLNAIGPIQDILTKSTSLTVTVNSYSEEESFMTISLQDEDDVMGVEAAFHIGKLVGSLEHQYSNPHSV